MHGSFAKCCVLTIFGRCKAEENLFSCVLQVPENSPGDTLVGKLLVTDPDNAVNDAAQHFTFELLDDADSRFFLEDDQLMVSAEDAELLFCGTGAEF